MSDGTAIDGPTRSRAMVAARRTAALAAIFMIGDGLLGLVQPKRHVALWRSDTPAIDMFVRPFAGRSARRRRYGALQIAGGLIVADLLHR